MDYLEREVRTMLSRYKAYVETALGQKLPIDPSRRELTEIVHFIIKNNNKLSGYPLEEILIILKRTYDEEIVNPQKASVQKKHERKVSDYGNHDYKQTMEISNDPFESLDKSHSSSKNMNYKNDTKNTVKKLKGLNEENGKSFISPTAYEDSKHRPPVETMFEDLPGMEEYTEELIKLIGIPIKMPEIYKRLGLDPPGGVLLYGPPGCGKTILSYALANELNVNFFSVSAPSIVSGISGESERKIRNTFQEAKRNAPAIIFIDEIDAITPKRDNTQKEMEIRIVSQLLICMDETSSCHSEQGPVIVIGATNRQDSIDPALRRAGRFDREINIRIPTEAVRAMIIRKHCSKMLLSEDVNFQKLAKLTPGYVGADLKSLVLEAGLQAAERIFKNVILPATLHNQYMHIIKNNSSESPKVHIENTRITNEKDTISIVPIGFTDMVLKYKNSSLLKDLINSDAYSNKFVVNYEDFLQALTKVQPSSKREGFVTSASGVTWDDIGAMTGIRDELRMYVVEPIKNPEIYKTIGMIKTTGILLYGPPGCGKTLVAKAVANESHSNFISVNGPELLNKYVGESERAIRTVFSRAQASAPCIIFFDELDAICPSRSSNMDTHYSSRIVNTLLTEMDGMNERKQVYVIAATNRPELIDGAMLRPGRLDKTLYVDLPTNEDKVLVLKTLTRKLVLAADIDFFTISYDKRCDGFSCADLSALTRDAALIALKKKLKFTENSEQQNSIGRIELSTDDFLTALSKLRPSVEKKDRKRYELLRARFSTYVNATEFEPISET